MIKSKWTRRELLKTGLAASACGSRGRFMYKRIRQGLRVQALQLRRTQ